MKHLRFGLTWGLVFALDIWVWSGYLIGASGSFLRIGFVTSGEGWSIGDPRSVLGH